jgi:hypothetical protein
VDQDLLGGYGRRLVVGSFDELAAFETGSGADEGDEVGVRSRSASGLALTSIYPSGRREPATP